MAEARYLLEVDIEVEDEEAEGFGERQQRPEQRGHRLVHLSQGQGQGWSEGLLAQWADQISLVHLAPQEGDMAR